jgi:hypothetical protein
MWGQALACLGAVIAICCPDIAGLRGHRGKKAAFIQQVALGLKPPNLRGVHASGGKPHRQCCCQLPCSSSLVDFPPIGRWLLRWRRRAFDVGMKGKTWSG